jgi:hypothetical protein
MRPSDCPTVETTEFLLAALERANEAVVIVDSDLRVSHFNAAAERIWDVTREDVVGLDASCLGLNDLQPSSEITIRRSNGSRLRAALSVSRVEIDDRSNYMAFVRDITAEVERREQITLLNLVAPACPKIIHAPLTASPSARMSARADRPRITASRYWPRISTPIRAGSPTSRCRSKSA